MTAFRSGDTFKLALGHNNVNGLEAFHRLHPRLTIYKYGFDVEYNRAESRVLRGDRKYGRIGLPYFVWILPVIERCVLDHLETTFFSGAESVDVTVRSYNERANAFNNYNAVMHYPDLNLPNSNRSEAILEVRLEFRDCMVL